MPVMKSISVHSKSTPETTYPSSEHEQDWGKESKLETVFESVDQKEDGAAQYADICKRKKLSICSQEVNKVLSENDVIRNSPIPVSSDRPESPVPSESADEFLHFEQCKLEAPKNKLLQGLNSRPHSVRSISPCERPLTPSQVVVFPPERPSYIQTPKIISPKPIYARSQYESDQREHNYQVTEPSSDEERREIFYKDQNDDMCQCIIERTRETLRVTCISPVPTRNETEIHEMHDHQISLNDLPRPMSQPGLIASGLTTASNRPFTPIEPAKATIFTEPVPLPPETIPYLPTSKEECHRPPDTERAMSPMVCALTTATDRTYSPLPTTVKFEDLFPEHTDESVKEEKKRPSMAEALAVASTRPYTPLSQRIAEKNDENEKSSEAKIPDLSEDPSIILTRPIFSETKKPEKEVKSITKPVYVCSSTFCVTEAAFPPICDELKAKFEKRLRTGSINEKPAPQKKSTETTKQTEEPSDEKRSITLRSPFTATGLHKPVNLPHYQQCVKELASRNKTPSLSRRNTPTPSSRAAELSRKNTPTNFEATVSTQQKVFNPEFTSEARNSLLKTSALSFLTESKNISEKIPPVLGYQPGSIVENLSSYTKVEQCVKTVCEKTLKQMQASATVSSSQSTHANFQSKTNEHTLSRSSTPVSVELVKNANSQEHHSKPNERQIPVNNPSRSSTPVLNKPVISSVTSSQHAHITTSSKSHSDNTRTSIQTLSKSMAASQLSYNLSKTLSALTSKNQSSNISSKNLSTSNTITSSDPNLTGSTFGGGSKGGTSAGFSAPRRGKGVWNPQNSTPGARIPLCAQCSSQIRYTFFIFRFVSNLSHLFPLGDVLPKYPSYPAIRQLV